MNFPFFMQLTTIFKLYLFIKCNVNVIVQIFNGFFFKFIIVFMKCVSSILSLNTKYQECTYYRIKIYNT